MANSYVSVDTLKGTAALNITGTAYDARLRGLLEHVSRQVDRFCNRVFFTFTETRYFDGPSGTTLLTSDVIALTSLKEDTNADGTFETTWATSDYHLWPYNAAPTSDWGRPYTRLVVNSASTGTQDEFLAGQRVYEAAGTWGYCHLTLASGLNGTLADATGTSITLNGTAAAFELGQTVFVESEQCYIRASIIGTGTAITVDRAVNGSTGTAHSDKAVTIVQYPGAIQEAVLIQGARLWKRKDSGFASQVGFPETGQLLVWKGGIDPDVKELLMPYRRLAVGLV